MSSEETARDLIRYARGDPGELREGIAAALTAAEKRGADRAWLAALEIGARDEREACADIAECMSAGVLTEAGGLHWRTPREMKQAIGAAIRKRGSEG
jgi:hypothetical protein